MPEERMTPLMVQYYRIKRKVPDAILFFRVGDFYETFGKDAIIVSKELGIVLTSRDKERDKTPMAGVPHHSAGGYIARLVRKGYKVAIAEQLEEPSPRKKIVKRDIVRIITPGTVVEEFLLNDRYNNYLASIVKGKKGFGFAICDVSTGEFMVTQLEGSQSLDDLISELSRFQPSECVIPESLSQNSGVIDRIQEEIKLTYTPLPDYYFDLEYARETLLEFFNVTSLEGFGCDKKPLAISAAGAIITYLKETQRTKLGNIKRIRTYIISKYMILDGTTISTLELLKNFRDGSTRGTLLEVLDKTMTAMGSRLLKKWIILPLQDIKEINKRLDAVEELYNNSFMRRSLRDLLNQVYDIERIVSRLNLGRLNPKDLIALKESLKRVPKISEELKKVKSELLIAIREKLVGLPHLVNLIEKAIVDDPPATIQEGGIIKDGYNSELDELRSIYRDGKQWILSLEKKERNRTGIKSLKVGYNKVFGYYIEVPKTQLSRVPSNYIRKQTLVNAERYITPELKEFEEKILHAEEKIKQLEYELFLEVRDQVCKETPQIQEIANNLAILDVLACFAEIAKTNNYVRPIVDESYIIEIKEGRHPVVEQMIDEPFVPNDTYLNNEDVQIMILTGPNMSGKSTYSRQVALIALLAHMGSFVPAKAAHIGLIDRIFTRIGAVDDITKRQSTFMVEMLETANILNNATERSLIILDEIGRGTSTFDGMSIAWAVLEYIHNYIGAKTIFATHYHHLTQIEGLLDRVKNYHILVKEYRNKMIFIRKVVEGPTDKSYGIQVAKLAGLPDDVIERANLILKHIEKTSNIEIPVELIRRENNQVKRRKLSTEVVNEEDLLPELAIDKEKVKEVMEKKAEQEEKEKPQEKKTEHVTILDFFLSEE
ncbi:MAG: DNA mismatch repair protein MutS [Candidatus Njordarchaeum guaymaensis]